MIAIPRFFAAVALLAAAVVSAAPEAYPACDLPSKGPVHGECHQMSMLTDDKPFFLDPELGACGVVYNDEMMGACLSPGWVDYGIHNSCGRKTTVINPANGKKVEVVIIDTCKSATCNDIMLTKAAFVALGGNTEDGLLKNNVKWYFNDQHKGGKRDE
ncbi:unnamed protein product [Tilletia controversa]|uniref:RlpA-like protein double-psi beta-barrel domain-containing protein n=3 Tax=Tilletia TaxID=13289 RepID=A0A8X7MQM7_9BASI|nr:hypothetical protein CF328_g5145 [Tilletia controversa]KAE8193695.1 hypothetical protein CF336_g3876 [Tilletia laevis]KAE8247732.1 hypothetical protein A4X03_0g6970 [Tilletia caries]KAE8198301.1 hypothetical protein CF335_g4416 [Tilletia laevis]KAE8245571.1 hypothetical protein A4X06_0g5589 [Tilletia controversa]